MTMLPADVRTALAEAVRGACERLVPEHRLRHVAYENLSAESGFDQELWRLLCGQVGVAAMAVPESLGGAGYGASAQAVVAHELGRVLAPVPFLASAVWATDLLVAAGAPPDLLGDLMEGNRTAAVVAAPNPSFIGGDTACVKASRNGDAWALRGSVRHVLNGAAADYLVVIAHVDSHPAIFVADSDDAGVQTLAEGILDGTRPMATVTLDDASAQRLMPDTSAQLLLDRSLRRTAAVLSAEQVGTCERVVEMAAEYARTRKQFDRFIGSFQAVKHRCADMLIDLEMARSASMAALESVDGGDDAESRWQVSMAKAVCSEALRAASHANVQIHGGIGFTWEHPAGLYVRRARTDEVLFGLPGAHWKDMAVRAGLFETGQTTSADVKTCSPVAM